jgi:hypothetical protein
MRVRLPTKHNRLWTQVRVVDRENAACFGCGFSVSKVTCAGVFQFICVRWCPFLYIVCVIKL